MKKFLLGAAMALATIAVAPAANAAVFTPVNVKNFSVNFEADDGSISATIGNTGLAGMFEDVFNFNLLTNGIGSGGISASFSSLKNKITLTYVAINGTPIEIDTSMKTGFTSAEAAGVNLLAGKNSIVIRGTAEKNASYGGNITFVPNAVPEPATWAMMLVGFGMMGASMRYRRRSTATAFA
jgi:opacity protein-like surface antigen